MNLLRAGQRLRACARQKPSSGRFQSGLSGPISRLALQAAQDPVAVLLARHEQSTGLFKSGLGSSPYRSTAAVLDATSARSLRFLHHSLAVWSG